MNAATICPDECRDRLAVNVVRYAILLYILKIKT